MASALARVGDAKVLSGGAVAEADGANIDSLLEGTAADVEAAASRQERHKVKQSKVTPYSCHPF